MTRFFAFLYLLLLVSLTSNAQNFSSNTDLLINEIGFVKGTNQGFIELVLVNGSEGAIGWSVDNLSNANFQDSGKIGIGSNFPSLPSGTPLLIYNNQVTSPDIDPQLDHQMTPAGFYQLPFDSEFLTKLSIGGSELSGGGNSWTDFLSFDNAENGVLLRDPSGGTRAYHTWGFSGVGANAVFLQTATLGGIDPNTRALVFTSDCTIGGTNGGGGDFELEERSVRTPGRYNSWENEIFIHTIQTGNLAVLNFEIQCTQLQPDAGTPYFGKVRIDFIGGIGPYAVTFTGPPGSPSNAQVEPNYALINFAPAGNYDITVTDSRGCSRRCPAQIASQIEELEICEGESIIIGRPLTGQECGHRWEPETGLFNSENSLTGASPEETTTYKLVISDGIGGIAVVEEYKVKVNEVPEVNITPNPIVICSLNELPRYFDSGGEKNWSYSWSDPFGQILGQEKLLEVNNSGYYYLTVTDQNGCTNTDNSRVINANNFNEMEDFLSSNGYFKYSVTVEEELPAAANDNQEEKLFENSVSNCGSAVVFDPISNERINVISCINADVIAAQEFGFTSGAKNMLISDFCDVDICSLEEFLTDLSFDYYMQSLILNNPQSESDYWYVKFNSVPCGPGAVIDENQPVVGTNYSCEYEDEFPSCPNSNEDIMPYAINIENEISFGWICSDGEWVADDITQVQLRNPVGQSDDIWGDGIANPASLFELTRNATTLEVTQARPSLKAWQFVNQVNTHQTQDLEDVFFTNFMKFEGLSDVKLEIIQHFIEGNPMSEAGQQSGNVPLVWECGGDLSRNVALKTTGILNLRKDLNELFEDWFFENNNTLNGLFPNTVNFNADNMSWPSLRQPFWAGQIFGGIQGMHIKMLELEGEQGLVSFFDSVKFKYLIELQDTFGAGTDDATSGFKDLFYDGLMEMWVLQHFRNNDTSERCLNAPCYIPFTNSVIIVNDYE